MKRWIASLAVGLVTAEPASQAHHSIAGVYDGSRQVTIEGVVAEFHFVNPHPYVTAEITEAGATRQWRLEMDNRSELEAIGVTAGTLKSGDRIVVSGSPARRQPQALYVRRLDRPADGFRYEQVGSSPRIRTVRSALK